MPLVGLIGGIGTKSTTLFVELLIARERVTQQKTPHFLLNCNSNIPIGSSNADEVLTSLRENVEILARGGATHIGFICNTAHLYLKELSEFFPSLIFIDMIGTVCRRVEERFPNAKSIGLIGTKKVITGTLFSRGLTKSKIVLPSDEVVDLINTCTFNILDGKTEINIQGKENAIKEVLTNEMQKMKDDKIVDVFVLACTDLTSIFREKVLNENIDVVDPLDVLVDLVLDVYKQ